jgi:sugar lactone lactonase YvrE
MRLRTLVTVALVAGVFTAPSTATAAPNPCAPWTVKVLASGLGSLENIEPDGAKGLFFSTTSGVARFTRTEGVKPFATATSPGGLRVRGNYLYFNTGNSLQSALLGTADGTIQKLDLRSGRQTTFATGLVMPNGLAFLPDGSAVTSRDLGILNPTGITRVTPKGVVQPKWSNQSDSNGMAVDPTGKWLYTDETFTLGAKVYRTEIANPSNRQAVTSLQGLGIFKGLDDLTISTSGKLYIAANLSGEVIRLDPITKQSCVIASGITNASAVKQGRGTTFPSGRLYTTGFDGRLLELIPPAGVTP